LSSADIFVRPSLSEGLGISFLEAMAVGLPIVATNVGGIPDFLKDGKTGLFCEVDNPKSVAEKVMRLMNEPDLYRAISHNGRKLVEEKYSWDTIAARFDKLFLS
ncbi:MAG: glycosyltransferase family 4 protein, partial [Candidatus Vogelbacteria bacterium]|nr:glycosyltransferase family 4 protein [Candidatus Vogelbacteria bacterium]